MSRSTDSEIIANYAKPIVLRIWGGDEFCSRKELLVETNSIEHANWREYMLILKPKKKYQFITLKRIFSGKKKLNIL